MADDFILSDLGTGAVLFDVAVDGAFDDGRQERLLWLAGQLADAAGVGDVVPGMNNLMVVFDPLMVDGETLRHRLREGWQKGGSGASTRRRHEIDVVYGGPDLQDFSDRLGLSVDQVVERHAGASYKVAAIGAMPGFPYLSGLDPSLATARRAVPRQGIPGGAVIVGGGQAGIMPITAPSGWHILGHTTFRLFDANERQPATLKAGDEVRFIIAGVGL